MRKEYFIGEILVIGGCLTYERNQVESILGR